MFFQSLSLQLLPSDAHRSASLPEVFHRRHVFRLECRNRVLGMHIVGVTTSTRSIASELTAECQSAVVLPTPTLSKHFKLFSVTACDRMHHGFAGQIKKFIHLEIRIGMRSAHEFRSNQSDITVVDIRSLSRHLKTPELKNYSNRLTIRKLILHVGPLLLSTALNNRIADCHLLVTIYKGTPIRIIWHLTLLNRDRHCEIDSWGRPGRLQGDHLGNGHTLWQLRAARMDL